MDIADGETDIDVCSSGEKKNILAAALFARLPEDVLFAAKQNREIGSRSLGNIIVPANDRRCG